LGSVRVPGWRGSRVSALDFEGVGFPVSGLVREIQELWGFRVSKVVGLESDLGVAEDLGAQHDVAGLVHPVHVPEGRRDGEHRVRHRRQRLQ